MPEEVSNQQEQNVLGEIAALSIEVAGRNIRTYLDSNRAIDGDNSVINVVKQVMKIADEANAELKSSVDASVQAAINNLERYRQSL
ncbi:MAG: hypothetical protein VKJ64_00185 [Leptolyngbyaceae bacterium]|nr:hypothetical protein [Leptolyngbyaceae bacterium]